MTTLVDGQRTWHRVDHPAGVVCYTHIMFGKSECKRMLTFSNGTGFQRKTDVGKQQLLDLFLRIRVIVSFKKTAIRLRRSQDLIEQRHQPFLQFRKNTIDRSRIHSFLVLVEQYFISILSGVGISTALNCLINELFQIRGKD